MRRNYKQNLFGRNDWNVQYIMQSAPPYTCKCAQKGWQHGGGGDRRAQGHWGSCASTTVGEGRSLGACDQEAVFKSTRIYFTEMQMRAQPFK